MICDRVIPFDILNQEEINEFFIQANAVIRNTGKHNFECARIPIPSPWNLNRFEELLQTYQFHNMRIIELLRYGWPIETVHICEGNKFVPNQKGARENHQKVKAYVNKQLKDRTIIGPFNENPLCSDIRLSPIDAIPKKDSDDLRIIMNLSHPQEGGSVNDGIDKHKYLGQEICLKYPNIDSFTEMIRRVGVGCAIFKTDLKKAFKQLGYDPASINLVAFMVDNLVYIDVTVSMGLKIAAFICQSVVEAIVFIYEKRGYCGLNYLDDIAGAALWSIAYEAFNALCSLLEEIGVWEAKEKRCLPDVQMPFLGINCNTLTMSISLTNTRLFEIRNETETWLNKKSCSKKDMQRLVGKLNFAAGTVRAGRLFFSRILDAMKKMPKHGIRVIDKEVLKDIKWWRVFMSEFDGISIMAENDYRLADEVIESDACLQGLGGLCGNEYFHIQVPDHIRALEQVAINELECLALLICLRIWAKQCAGLKIICKCDNETTVKVVNAGKAHNSFTQKCLREIAFISARNSVQVKVQWVKGISNRSADKLSRWDKEGSCKNEFFQEMMDRGYPHMKQVLIHKNMFDFNPEW